MRSFVCFLTILHITIGQIQDVYDAQRCGISQINDYAQNSPGKRVRRSSLVDVQSINRTTNGDVANEDLDENAVWDQDDQDDNDFMQEKVMGGRRAARGEIPWAVLILTPGDLCGGTLVSRRHVITAAHCFRTSNMKMGKCNISDMYSQESTTNSTVVYVGGSCFIAGAFGCDTSDFGKMYRVARASYEQYFTYNCKGTHDIAILELTEDVPRTINHVCLPFMHQLEEIEDPYLKLRSFGWGIDPLRYPGIEIPSPYLQIAELGAKLPEEKCNRMKKWEANDTFCTASGPQYICQGDSGGGVTATVHGRNYLMGIISYGPNCKSVAKGKAISHPQVSTDIMHYKTIIKTWILTKSENQSIATTKTTWRPQVPNPSHKTTPASQPSTDQNWKTQYPYGGQNLNPPTNINHSQSQPRDQNWRAQYQYGSQVSNPPPNIPHPLTQIRNPIRGAQNSYGSQSPNPPSINDPQSQPVTSQYGAQYQYQYGSQTSNPPTNIGYTQSRPVTNENWKAQYQNQPSIRTKIEKLSIKFSISRASILQSRLVTNQYGTQYQNGIQASNPPTIDYPQSQPITSQYRSQYQYGSQALNLPTNNNYPQSQPITNRYGAQYQYGSQASNPPRNYPQSQPLTNQYGTQYQYGSQASNLPTDINYPQSQPLTNQYRAQYRYGTQALDPTNNNYPQSQLLTNQD